MKKEVLFLVRLGFALFIDVINYHHMVTRCLIKFGAGATVGVLCGSLYVQSRYCTMDDVRDGALQHYFRPNLAPRHSRTLAGYPITFYTEGKLREMPAPLSPLSEHSSETYDVCVVGGGFAGLHTALALAEKGKRVVILEGKRVGSQASGRNGGDAIVGFHTEVDEIAQVVGSDSIARDIYQHSVAGYQRLWDLINQYKIQCGAKEEGAVTVTFAKRIASMANAEKTVDACILASLDEERAYAASVKERFGEVLEVWDKAALEKNGIHSDRFAYGIFNPKNITLNPLELSLGLARACRSKGATIYEGSPVTGCTKLPKHVPATAAHAAAVGPGGSGASPSVSVPHVPSRDVDTWLVTTEHGSVLANHVVLATNGIPAHLSLKLNLATAPLVTAMMLTKPLDKQELDAVMTAKCAVFDERFALAYFRRVEGNRLLYGGLAKGVPMDRRFAEEKLVADLTATFPSLKGQIHPDISWQGRLEAKLPVFPLIGRDEGTGLWYSYGYSGHGLVPTCAAGELLASAIASLDIRKDGSRPKADERYKLWGLVNYGPAAHNLPTSLPPTLLPFGGPLGLIISPLYCKYAELKDRFDQKV